MLNIFLILFEQLDSIAENTKESLDWAKQNTIINFYLFGKQCLQTNKHYHLTKSSR